MSSVGPVLKYDWLGACRRAAEGLRSVLQEHPTSVLPHRPVIAARTPETLRRLASLPAAS